MERRVACVGDALSTGGRILPYAGRVCTFGSGHQVALIGGDAYCEACKSIGRIAKTGGPRRINFMGETAADGDMVLCKCAKPPRIVATLSGNSWCDDMAGSEYASDTFSTFGYDDSASSHFAYDQHFLIEDEETGEPLVNRPYRLTYSGGVIDGRTDSHGHTQRIGSDNAETVRLEIF